MPFDKEVFKANTKDMIHNPKKYARFGVKRAPEKFVNNIVSPISKEQIGKLAHAACRVIDSKYAPHVQKIGISSFEIYASCDRRTAQSLILDLKGASFDKNNVIRDYSITGLGTGCKIIGHIKNKIETKMDEKRSEKSSANESISIAFEGIFKDDFNEIKKFVSDKYSKYNVGQSNKYWKNNKEKFKNDLNRIYSTHLANMHKIVSSIISSPSFKNFPKPYSTIEKEFNISNESYDQKTGFINASFTVCLFCVVVEYEENRFKYRDKGSKLIKLISEKCKEYFHTNHLIGNILSDIDLGEDEDHVYEDYYCVYWSIPKKDAIALTSSSATEATIPNRDEAEGFLGIGEKIRESKNDRKIAKTLGIRYSNITNKTFSEYRKALQKTAWKIGMLFQYREVEEFTYHLITDGLEAKFMWEPLKYFYDTSDTRGAVTANLLESIIPNDIDLDKKQTYTVIIDDRNELIQKTAEAYLKKNKLPGFIHCSKSWQQFKIRWVIIEDDLKQYCEANQISLESMSDGSILSELVQGT